MVFRGGASSTLSAPFTLSPGDTLLLLLLSASSKVVVASAVVAAITPATRSIATTFPVMTDLPVPTSCSLVIPPEASSQDMPVSTV